jgi:molecular chaperone GrpE
MQYSELEPDQAAQAIVAQPGEESQMTGAGSEAARLKEENERLRSEWRREYEMHVRTLADFDNYRRRIERECARAAQAGKRELLLPLLEVMDDCERALQHADDDPQSVAAGVHVIHRRLVRLFAEQGVTAIESEGKYFNPLLHEAVSMVQDGKAEPGTVLDEVSRGWRLGNELLRPASSASCKVKDGKDHLQ